MKYLPGLLLFLFLFDVSALAAPYSKNRPSKETSANSGGTTGSKKIRSEAGLNIPAWGVAIDAVYDKRLDNLVPGYKLVNVVLTNRSPSTIYLDPTKDVWIIRDSLGKNHRGINHLRFTNEKMWLSLPVGLKDQLEYPHAVRTGNSTKIDLFFPIETELAGFREVSWKSDHFKQVFDVYTALEKNLDWDSKSEKIPDTPAVRQSIEKYEGEIREQDAKDKAIPDGGSDLTPEQEAVYRELLNSPSSLPEDDTGNDRPGYELLATDPIEPTPTAQRETGRSIEQSPPPFDPRLDEVTTIPMD